MFKLSTKKGNVIIEMDNLTACAVIQMLRMAIGDNIHEGFSDERKDAIVEVDNVISEVFYNGN